MASNIIHGGGRGVTPARVRAHLLPIEVLNFQSRILQAGGQIVEIGAHGGEIWIDWLPAGADPDLEPIRAFLIYALPPVAANDDEETILVARNESAIATLEPEEPSQDVVNLAAWVARRVR